MQEKRSLCGDLAVFNNREIVLEYLCNPLGTTWSYNLSEALH